MLVQLDTLEASAWTRGRPYLYRMSATLLTILLGIGLLALAFAGIAVKIWAKKDGQFAGTCASNNPLVQKEGGSCGFCGARPEEQCRREEIAQG